MSMNEPGSCLRYIQPWSVSHITVWVSVTLHFTEHQIALQFGKMLAARFPSFCMIPQ
jgi:hypothetical protein